MPQNPNSTRLSPHRLETSDNGPLAQRRCSPLILAIGGALGASAIILELSADSAALRLNC
jgi:hypothetical protein